MDLSGINKYTHAKKTFEETIKLDSLDVDETVRIGDVKKVYSKKLGQNFFIANIEGARSLFLPKKITEYLLKNEGEIQNLEVLAKKGYLSFKYLGASGLRFSMKPGKKGQYQKFD